MVPRNTAETTSAAPASAEQHEGGSQPGHKPECGDCGPPDGNGDENGPALLANRDHPTGEQRTDQSARSRRRVEQADGGRHRRGNERGREPGTAPAACRAPSRSGPRRRFPAGRAGPSGTADPRRSNAARNVCRLRGAGAREGSRPPEARLRRWPRRSSRPRRCRPGREAVPRSRARPPDPPGRGAAKGRWRSRTSDGRPVWRAPRTASGCRCWQPRTRARSSAYKRPKRRVPARRVQREPDAASRERELRDEKQPPPVDRVGDRAAEQRASEHGDDLCQADETHVQRGMGELEHLVRDRDHREL